MPRLPLMLLAAATAALAQPSMARPALTSAQPAQGAAASKVTQITLNFSEPITAAASGVSVLMTAMPGMDHHQPMKMGGVTTKLSPDGKALVASLPRALPVGSYDVPWHVAGADGQNVAGKVSFDVKP
ncbi:copper resistance protein CopC [Novosphingobium umbonatum]|uniref:Copper resistance protein CopC n=1 Tax=Novosphingobium umbonatum TaxID=1908524 RepID=A0A437N2B6_9SPHN|nr:copper resistance protein CopC [Novosphingobium umbonatum]RVU04071.1 copper resistance protein CopC [Novosphingobium umbonatum]